MKVRITKVPDKSLNARKWKHGDGGFINQYDGETEETSWLRRFLSTPTRVPNMTGTATAATTGLRDIPLMDSTVGKELAVAGTAMLPLTPYLGTQAALGIDTMGRYAMPSTFLKGLSYYAPKAAGALGAVSPWLDAGALSLWSAEAGKAAMDAKRQGRTGDAIGMGTLAALPIVMPLGMKAYQGLRNGLRMKPFEIGNVSSAELYDPIVGHSTAPPEAYFAEEAARENAEIARLGRETLLAEPVDMPAIPAREWSPEEFGRLMEMEGFNMRTTRNNVPDPVTGMIDNGIEVNGRDYYFNPDEMTRLQNMMDGHTANLAAYTPEQIAWAQEQLRVDAPIIHDALAGNRSTAPTQTFLASAPTIAKTTESGYQIQRYPGYMLQSLMEGNPLEKQIGKNGTVSVNNIKALMKSAKKVDQAVIDKVLASDEFAGKKSIDYNKFRKAVQDELITYDRTPDTRWQDYGMERIGISSSNPFDVDAITAKRFVDDHPELGLVSDRTGEIYAPGADGKYGEPIPWSELEKEYPGWTEKYRPMPTKPESYTFSSSRIPNGSAKHYDANTLGHTRTYTTVDEPDVLHVMESQSDWAQEGLKPQNRFFNSDGKDITEDIRRSWTATRETPVERMFDYDSRFYTFGDTPEERAKFDKLVDEYHKLNSHIQSSNTFNSDDFNRQQELKKELEDIATRPREDGRRGRLMKNAHLRNGLEERIVSPNVQERYLTDNYTSRQIQENLRYAAEKGQKKMRYPTRETAAKIEGYPKREAYFDSEGNDITTSGRQMYEWSKEDQQAVSKLKDQRKSWDDLRSKYDLEWQGIENDLDPDDKLLVAIEHDNMLLEDAIAKGADETTIAYLREGIQKNMAKYKDMTGLDANTIHLHEPEIQINYLDNEISRLEAKQDKLLPGITKKTVYDYEDILRKYTEFPKQYKKLYKNADVRIVTDPKGNTWYEVDVPEGYLQQEWKYSTGGILGKANQIYSGDMSKIRQAIQNARLKQKK